MEIAWNSIVPVERAVKMLGYPTLEALCEDLSVTFPGSAYVRATGCWDANDREYYVAWRSIGAHLTAIGFGV